MNPTITQAYVDRALADDPMAARPEYLAEFRDDVANLIAPQDSNCSGRLVRSRLSGRSGPCRNPQQWF